MLLRVPICEVCLEGEGEDSEFEESRFGSLKSREEGHAGVAGSDEEGSSRVLGCSKGFPRYLNGVRQCPVRSRGKRNGTVVLDRRHLGKLDVPVEEVALTLARLLAEPVMRPLRFGFVEVDPMRPPPVVDSEGAGSTSSSEKTKSCELMNVIGAGGTLDMIEMGEMRAGEEEERRVDLARSRLDGGRQGVAQIV